MDLEQAFPKPSPSVNFPQLPYELRIHIWRYTLRPRVVEVKDEGIQCLGFRSPTDLPVALSVCKESRIFALERYPLCFGSIFDPPAIRFNFEIDTLYLPKHITHCVPHFFAVLKEHEIRQLRYLALSGSVFSTDQYPSYSYRGSILKYHNYLRQALDALYGLKELLLVYPVMEMTPRIEEDIDSEMEFFEGHPDEIWGAGCGVRELPHVDKWLRREFGTYNPWYPKNFRIVYGWKGPPSSSDSSWSS